MPGQCLLQAGLALLGRGAAQEEPTDEREPDPADESAQHEEDLQQTEADEEGAEGTAGPGGGDLGPAAVTGRSPHDRLEDAATVEGRAGQEVERAEDRV